MNEKNFIWIVPLILLIGFTIGYLSAFKPIVKNEFNFVPGEYTFDIGDNFMNIYLSNRNEVKLFDNYTTDKENLPKIIGEVLK